MAEDQIPEPEETPKFEVWEENWPTVEAFLTCSTQWRTSMSGLLGLDYTAVFQVFDLYDIKDRKVVFNGIQIMENAVLAYLHSMRDK